MNKGDLKEGEAHPASYHALEYIKSIGGENLCAWREVFASCALSGNRLAEISGETLRRLLDGEPVSDRYLLGLAWVIFRKDLPKGAGTPELLPPVRDKTDSGDKS